MKIASIAVVIAGLLIAGAILFSNKSGSTPLANANNVSVVNGVQIIEIGAKGGYRPQSSVAKAGLPTIIRFKTSGTFDCSLSVRIPKKGISKILPQTGTEDIDIGVAEVGILQGTCGMGMYPFRIDFKS